MSAAEFIQNYGGETSALPAAVQWIEGVLLGQVGTVIAVLAIAGVGFAMLQGRIALRHGMRVVLGCFILFGAPLIAQGLAGLARGTAGPPPTIELSAPIQQMPTAPQPVLPQPPPQGSNPFDPYAGVSTVPK